MSGLSRNKLTTTSNPKRSTVSSVLSGVASKNSKLKDSLRRVMSDRVMKITRCSQKANVTKKDSLLNSSGLNLSQNRIAMASNNQIADKAKLKAAAALNQTKILADRIKSPESLPSMKDSLASQTQKLISTETSPKFLNKLTGSTTTNISPNAKLSNKISLQPIKTFDLKDKKSLVNHIITSYNDVISSQGSIVLSVQSIINSITHYIEANQLELKSSLEEILKENLYKSSIVLRQKYADDELSEKLKLEGQLQVLLQIENYIVANQSPNSNKVRVDDDAVWDIANSIRWVKQKFKDFKIERFLFGEIYANYYLNSPDFIASLMEELGYDQEDNANESSSDIESPKKSPSKVLGSQQQLTESNDKLKSVSSSAKFLSQLSQTQASNIQLSSILKEDSNSSFSLIGGVNSLFEEEEGGNTNDVADQNENDDTNNNQNNVEKGDILDQFMKKKTGRKSVCQNSTINRSIVIQKTKRTRLKVRSPFKSPSKSFQKRHENRRSPRIKDKQVIPPELTGTGTQKRPRTYLITDTPDHKQNATIITTRQLKLRKRFSFQQFANCASSPSVLPSVPDTPVKGDTKEALSSGALFQFQKFHPSPSKAYMSPQKIYASPQKIYKTPQKIICGSPLKVFATPSPKKKFASPLKVYATPSPSKKLTSPAHVFASPQNNFASPLRKSPARRVVFK